MKEVVNSSKSLEIVIELLKQSFEQFKYLDVEIKVKGRGRTNKQNAALHKYFTMLASELNNSGWDMRRTLKPGVDIPWTAELVKEHMWRPVQIAMINEQSTAKVKSKDYPLIYETLNRHTASKLGISVPWPSMEE